MNFENLPKAVRMSCVLLKLTPQELNRIGILNAYKRCIIAVDVDDQKAWEKEATHLYLAKRTLFEWLDGNDENEILAFHQNPTGPPMNSAAKQLSMTSSL